MDELFGLPAHPLVVHAPVVLLPLAVVGVAAMMVRPAWYLRLRWPVLGITIVGAIGAVLAAGTGEELEELVEDSATREARRAISEHAEAGEAARLFAILFLLAVLAYVLVPWFLERRARSAAASDAPAGEAAPRWGGPGWLRAVLMLAVAITAVGSLVTIIDAGHSGADSVWGDVTTGVDDGDDGGGDDGGGDD